MESKREGFKMTPRFLTCIHGWTLQPLSELGGDFGIHALNTKQTTGYSDMELRREVWNEDTGVCVYLPTGYKPHGGDRLGQ